jgi:hypothetical protein
VTIDAERLAEVLKEYDSGRIRVKYMPGRSVGPGGNPTRFHRAWADALITAYNALETSDSLATPSETVEQ